MTIPYPVIPTMKELKDVIAALNNVRSYWSLKLKEDQAALAVKSANTTYLEKAGIDLSTANFTVAPATTLKSLVVSVGSAAYAIIGPNTTGTQFLVTNNDAVNSVTVKVAGQTGVTIGPLTHATVVCNGTDYTFLNLPSGNVTGPVSAASGNLAEYDGVTGLIIKDGGITHASVSAVITLAASEYCHTGNVVDDGTFNLPAITNGARGVLVVGADDERADFSIKSDGTVNIIEASANVVANADTDTKFCLGTSVASPVVIKNRLGGTKAVMLSLRYN